MKVPLSTKLKMRVHELIRKRTTVSKRTLMKFLNVFDEFLHRIIW